MPRYLFTGFLGLLLNAMSLQAETLMIGGSGTDLGTFKLLAEAYRKHHPGTDFTILSSMGSGGGIKALKRKKLSLALLSRAPRPDERFVTMKSIHYAYTPMVIAVARSLDVNNISSEDVYAIYTGELKHWKDGNIIRPVLRPLTDSDSKLLLENIGNCEACLRKGLQRQGIPVAMSDQEAADMIERIPGGVGTSTLSQILSEGLQIKPLRLDGVKPVPENIHNQTYPMYKDLYMVYSQHEASERLYDFIKFVRSAEGRDILERTGHYVIKAYP